MEKQLVRLENKDVPSQEDTKEKEHNRFLIGLNSKLEQDLRMKEKLIVKMQWSKGEVKD